MEQKPGSEKKKVNSNFNLDLNTITICGRTRINSNLLKIFAVLSEVDLMPKYISQFEEMSKLNEISPFRWLIQCKIKMPLTFSNRDLIVCGTGLINKEARSILLMFKSVNSVLGEPVPEETSSHKRIELVYGFYHIQYEADDCYTVTNCLNVDPKIPMVPWFILNKCIKESTYYIIDGLRSQINNPKANEVYKERIKEKEEFYKKLQKYLIL